MTSESTKLVKCRRPENMLRIVDELEYDNYMYCIIHIQGGFDDE